MSEDNPRPLHEKLWRVFVWMCGGALASISAVAVFAEIIVAASGVEKSPLAIALFMVLAGLFGAAVAAACAVGVMSDE